MGIDPVTHKPIADLLRDLAGTMAQNSSGNQVTTPNLSNNQPEKTNN
jgi:hypothetical protein